MLSELVNFGGTMVTVAEAMATMQGEGHDPRLIDRWVQGALLANRIHAR